MTKPRVNSLRVTVGASVFGLALLLVGCTGGPNKTNVELIQDMMDQENVKAQDWDPDRPGQRANMYPPKGTVPIGYKPYTYGFDVLKAEAELKNPLAGDFSEKTLARGKKKYDIYCSVCHGIGGAGDGSIMQYKAIMRPIPSLLTPAARTYKDGRLFHIIVMGQGVMGAYGNKIIDEADRWAVVNYIRDLQQKSLETK